MSTVTLSIGPKSYTIACADGEEAHIRALGGMIAEKYAQLGPARAPLEAQNLLFAALFLADELAETKKLAASASASASASAPAPEPDTAALDALRETVARLEDELAAARKTAAAAPVATSQFDLFGAAHAPSPLGEDVAKRLEALAARAEASAAALEAAAANT